LTVGFALRFFFALSERPWAGSALCARTTNATPQAMTAMCVKRRFLRAIVTGAVRTFFGYEREGRRSVAWPCA
jgi:hypothetical protein